MVGQMDWDVIGVFAGVVVGCWEDARSNGKHEHRQAWDGSQNNNLYRGN